jgi:hypothetical protein
MYEERIAELCRAASNGIMRPRSHYKRRLKSRPSPNEQDILFILCDDNPEVIEDNPFDSPSSCCLVWGTTADGRIGHVLCGYYPEYTIITAYFPAETEPYKWEDEEYRVRRRS